MIDTAPKSPRVLMKDGAWLVPEAERPSNWRSYGLAEYVEPVQPSEEQVAEAMSDVAAQMDATAVANPPVTGSREWHREYARQHSAAQRQAAILFAEHEPIIQESAVVFGADVRLIGFARLLFSGMLTGSVFTLQKLSGLPWFEVQQGKRNFIASGIWSGQASALKAYLVHLGDGSDTSDLGFWLNAMVGAGEIFGKISEDGEHAVYSATPLP